MDINECSTNMVGRHPWELSRTYCVGKLIKGFLMKFGKWDNAKYLNIGAGDLYFDKNCLLGSLKKHTCYAIDIGYTTEFIKENETDRVKLLTDFDSVGDMQFEYALMMDSLEYMEDDKMYLNMILSHIVANGMVFLTLPAYQKYYSEHDRIVGNLRRYDKKSFRKLLDDLADVEVVYDQYFYFSLLVVRVMQLLFKVQIDPEHKVTTGWEYTEKHIITKFVKWVLNIDFGFERLLRCVGIRFPGLSYFVVLKKKG